jgi:hypothetical protein
MAITGTLLKIGKSMAKTSGSLLKGVKKSTLNLRKSTMKRNKIKDKVFDRYLRFKKYKKEKKKRQEEESQLEQQKKPQEDPNVKKTRKSTSMFDKLMEFLGLILIGWITNKLPQIIDFVKKVVDTIKNIVNGFKNFFGDIVEFFQTIGEVIGNAFDAISNLKISDVGELVKKAFDGIKDAFGNIEDNLLGGVKSFIGLSKKKPKKDLSIEGLEKGEFDDEEMSSSFSEIQKELEKVNENWNKTMSTVERAGTGIDIVGSENSGILEEVSVDGEKVESPNSTEANIQKEQAPTGNNLNIDSKNEEIVEFDKEVKEKDSSNITIETLDGKILKSGDEGYKEELQKSKDAFILSQKKVSTKTITPERKAKDIVVIMDNKQQQMMNPPPQKNKSFNPVVDNTDTSVKEQILLQLA